MATRHTFMSPFSHTPFCWTYLLEISGSFFFLCCPQAIAKKGGPTTPDFTPYAGQPSNFCPLLDINAAPDLDTNPLNGIVDENTITLVGRVPRPIPNKSNAWVCAVAPAGGVVSVVATVSSAAAVVYPYTAKSPNTYVPCTAGKYMYKLGAINLANDARTDSCNSCFRGSYSNSGTLQDTKNATVML